jgi:hypothetical protein
MVSQGEMEYVRASHALGINTPSQCIMSNSFPIHRLVTRVNVYFSYFLMIRWRMMFCKIIPQISASWAPINMKLSLFDPVFHPTEAHIHGRVRFCFIVPLLYPVTVVLSVCKGVGG